MSKRDPRVNPRMGDVLRKTGKSREVSDDYDDLDGKRRIAYVGDWCCEPTLLLTSWRKWAKDAEVIHQTEGSEEGRS